MTYKGAPLYEKDGKIGVLVHQEYGPSWGSTCGAELAYDARIIQFWLEHKDIPHYLENIALWDCENDSNTPQHEAFVKFLKSIGYTRNIYVGGFDEFLALEFVDKNERFIIEEYDGYEHIKILPPDYGICFKEAEQ